MTTHGGATMRPLGSNTAEISATQKEWRRPELRKLPIGATSQGKGQTRGDDGGCTGKGDTVTCLS